MHCVILPTSWHRLEGRADYQRTVHYSTTSPLIAAVTEPLGNCQAIGGEQWSYLVTI